MINKILFVSYVFPPVSSPGAIRIERMAYHLSDKFDKVGVLTCENPYSSMVAEGVSSENSGYFVHYIKDFINKSSYAGSSKAERKKTLKGRLAQFLALFFFPDKNITWLPSVIWAKNKDHDYDYDVIIASSPSPTNLIVATYLGWKLNSKVVFEYRDLWTAAGIHHGKGRLRFFFEKVLERFLLRFADAIVTVSDVDKKTMKSFCKGLGKHKVFEVVRNGYDEKIMNELLDGYCSDNVSEKYIITYAGSFYNCERDPTALLSALNNIVKSGLISSEDLVFNIYGHPESCIVQIVRNLGSENIVSFKGMVGRNEVYKAMLDSHQLVTITRRAELARGEMTTKVYEYIGSKRSMISLSPPGFEINSVLEDIPGVKCLDVDAIDEIEIFLYDDIKRWCESANKQPRVYNSRNELFSRKQSAMKMMELIKCL